MTKGKKIGLTIAGILVVGFAMGFHGNTTTPTAAPAATHQTAVDKAKQAADAKAYKAVQLAELQAMGDWNISSNKQEFVDGVGHIQKYLSQGDAVSAYNEAKRLSGRADDLNTLTMNNQDMDNVPKDLPENVNRELKNVDPNLATGFMCYKNAFDSMAEYINKNDLSKLDDAKSNIQAGNSSLADAKASIDKAINMLK